MKKFLAVIAVLLAALAFTPQTSGAVISYHNTYFTNIKWPDGVSPGVLNGWAAGYEGGQVITRKYTGFSGACFRTNIYNGNWSLLRTARSTTQAIVTDVAGSWYWQHIAYFQKGGSGTWYASTNGGNPVAMSINPCA